MKYHHLARNQFIITTHKESFIIALTRASPKN